MPREMIWIEKEQFHGWGCSQCAWEFKPRGPAVGNSIIAMSIDFETQRDEEFKSHKCSAHPRAKPES
jgi:hypothetical protein